MPDRSDIAYLYDGSFQGLLCCVFESFERRELPYFIFTYENQTPVLFALREIQTDDARARRVLDGIRRKISNAARELVEYAFLTCLEEKELHILRFLHYGFKVGPKATADLTHPFVDVLEKAVRHLNNEAHLLLGFVRFREMAGVLVAEISPKNHVLPVIAPHFADRFSGERLLIVDRTHNEAMAYEKGKAEIFCFDALELSPDTTEEMYLQRLWRRFYDTIAIESRLNPRCRMGHMPKRYWAHLPEVNPALLGQGGESDIPVLPSGDGREQL